MTTPLEARCPACGAWTALEACPACGRVFEPEECVQLRGSVLDRAAFALLLTPKGSG